MYIIGEGFARRKEKTVTTGEQITRIGTMSQRKVYTAGLQDGLERALERLDGIDARSYERINILLFAVKETGELPMKNEHPPWSYLDGPMPDGPGVPIFARSSDGTNPRAAIVHTLDSKQTDKDMARRIVACMNACRNLSLEWLEEGHILEIE